MNTPEPPDNEHQDRFKLLADDRITIPGEQNYGWRKPERGQLQMIALIVGLTVFSLLYRVLVSHHLEQTSALFIGLPGILAILLATAPKPKSLMGSVMRGVTFALLLSGLLLGEGFICILMAAPIFYLVALIVVGCIHWWRHHKGRALGCVLLFLMPLSLEGTRPGLSFSREEAVTASLVVPGTVIEVQARLALPPSIDRQLPVYLRLGFPRPTRALGQGLTVGSLRRVHFEGGEGKPGDLIMRVGAIGDGWARFDTVSDATKVEHWLKLESATVRWSAVDATHTRVQWTIAYARLLDPAWYFRPWEHYGVRKAAEYLIEANAAPPPQGGRP